MFIGMDKRLDGRNEIVERWHQRDQQVDLHQSRLALKTDTFSAPPILGGAFHRQICNWACPMYIAYTCTRSDQSPLIFCAYRYRYGRMSLLPRSQNASWITLNESTIDNLYGLQHLRFIQSSSWLGWCWRRCCCCCYLCAHRTYIHAAINWSQHFIQSQ